MDLSDFHYDLPAELIAQAPLAERSASRLLWLGRDRGGPEDRQFRELPALLRAGDLLVFNDTRVIPARLLGHKETGGRVEVLVERILGERECLALMRFGKRPKAGSRIELGPGDRLRVIGQEGAFWKLRSEGRPLTELMDAYGHVPLPPYIDRPDEAIDQHRYQTVYADRPGAVAAPTAGLHFDDELLAALAAAGIERTTVTLHVGAGTFLPVRTRRVEDHRMHAEWLEVPDETCAAIAAARERGGRVVAVGTTAVRSLETAAADGELAPWRGDSRLFIYPGYEFRVVDGLVTNFHLPESTLLMLVSAFAGRERILAAYRHAVDRRYRFFSYGDAMLLVDR